MPVRASASHPDGRWVPMTFDFYSIRLKSGRHSKKVKEVMQSALDRIEFTGYVPGQYARLVLRYIPSGSSEQPAAASAAASSNTKYLRELQGFVAWSTMYSAANVTESNSRFAGFLKQRTHKKTTLKLEYLPNATRYTGAATAFIKQSTKAVFVCEAVMRYNCRQLEGTEYETYPDRAISNVDAEVLKLIPMPPVHSSTFPIAWLDQEESHIPHLIQPWTVDLQAHLQRLLKSANEESTASESSAGRKRQKKRAHTPEPGEETNDTDVDAIADADAPIQERKTKKKRRIIIDSDEEQAEEHDETMPHDSDRKDGSDPSVTADSASGAHAQMEE
jgi:hypothetical protein